MPRQRHAGAVATYRVAQQTRSVIYSRRVQPSALSVLGALAASCQAGIVSQVVGDDLPVLKPRRHLCSSSAGHLAMALAQAAQYPSSSRDPRTWIQRDPCSSGDESPPGCVRVPTRWARVRRLTAAGFRQTAQAGRELWQPDDRNCYASARCLTSCRLVFFIHCQSLCVAARASLK